MRAAEQSSKGLTFSWELTHSIRVLDKELTRVRVCLKQEKRAAKAWCQALSFGVIVTGQQLIKRAQKCFSCGKA
jgi:hypothetical protein